MIIEVLFTVDSPNIHGDVSKFMNGCGVVSMALELIFKSFKDFEYKETNLLFSYQQNEIL